MLNELEPAPAIELAGDKCAYLPARERLAQRMGIDLESQLRLSQKIIVRLNSPLSVSVTGQQRIE